MADMVSNERVIIRAIGTFGQFEGISLDVELGIVEQVVESQSESLLVCVFAAIGAA